MNYEILYQWRDEIAKPFPSLNSWQVDNVALFSQGVIHAKSSQQEQIARQVACGEKAGSAARRLRRLLDNPQLDLVSISQDWSGWLLPALPLEVLYLGVDETKLGAHMAAMVVGVAWEARCIPLAWRCYNPQDYAVAGQVQVIKQLLLAIQASVPPQQRGYVLADRGMGTSPA